MTKKSASRLARDKKTRADMGVAPNTRFNREKASRSWYELKMVHNRSVAYVKKTAAHFAVMTDPRVLARISQNADGQRFLDLNTEAKAKAEEFEKRLNDLWDRHKDKRKLCLSHAELTMVFELFEDYQKFDMDYYLAFSAIVNPLSELWNKALSQLLGEQTEATGPEHDLVDPTVVSDIQLKGEFVEQSEALDGAATVESAKAEDGVPTYDEAVALGFNGSKEAWEASQAEADEPADPGVDPKIGRGLIRPVLEIAVPAEEMPAAEVAQGDNP